MTDLDNDAETPLDAANERIRRKMVRLLAGSIGIMFIGVMAVLAAIVYRTTSDSQPAMPAPGASVQLQLPVGAEVAETSLDGNRVLVRVFTPVGEELQIFDLRSGDLLSRHPLIRP